MAEDRFPSALRSLRRVTLPPNVFLELVSAGCCAVCVCRLTGVTGGLSIPHAVWATAFEVTFGGLARDESLRWPWSTGTCVACMGMLQDSCVLLDSMPAEGTNDSKHEARGRRRKGGPLTADRIPNCTVTEDAPAVSGSEAGFVRAARPMPFIYASLFPRLCDSVVTVARTR